MSTPIPLSTEVKRVLGDHFVMLIAGSRDTTHNPGVLRGARVAVQVAHEQGWALLCGDAWGVDREVINEANKLRVPIAVFGITPTPRNLGSKYGAYQQLPGLTYTQRDQYLILLADRALFIWNGKPESRGTLEGYRYAQHMGVFSHCIQFDPEPK